MNTDTPTIAARTAVVPSPPTTGRNRKAVWDLMDVDGKDVWCKRCGKLVHSSGRTHVERVEKHVFDRCVKRPSSGKITDIYQPKMNSSVLKQFQERFAWWVYTTGMAFYKTEHHTLLEALQILNPGINVPSSYQLANSLLDLAYEKSINRLTVSLCGRVVTLETDGWTDMSGMAVINYMDVSGELSFFLESAYTGTQSHDTPFLVADAKRVLTKYKHLNLCSVITDNTAANKSMWEAMQPDYPKMFFHGCVSHALHLMVKDMVERLPWLKSMQDGCKELVVFFKRNHKLWFCLRQKLKEKNVFAAESTLFSMVSARNFLHAKKKSQRQKRKMVYTLVTEVYKTFLDLPEEFDATSLAPRELQAVKEIVDERFAFVYGDAHGLAYLLDPRFCGEGMDVATRSSVELFLSTWYGEDQADQVLIQLSAFHRYVTELKDGSSRQWKLLCDCKLPVFDFWCGFKHYDILQSVAKQLFRCAGSTAAAERNFSTHAFIHSKLRNWLSPDRVEKLVHIFFNAKNVNNKDLDEYTHIEDVLWNSEVDEDAKDKNQDEDFVYY
ncbi:Transposase [Phytophthora megakarya]|uniref:Transposase n=1 Tax=Phytophthora megakarya TaxID=4795 RepID=A0A225V9M6_9STRA|nr:Transposase [Phytophthora megakarya]